MQASSISLRSSFAPFPKVEDAKAAGEVEDVQEDDESEETEVEVNANDYDYLLGVSATNPFHNTKTNIF